MKRAGLTVIQDEDGTVRHEFGPGKVETGKDVLKALDGLPVCDEGWDYHPCKD
ncbi:MAG: hypothetical protein GY749_08075 [Desulfobacteraceae bacterium]|nr:hypothetical protein [Desulfobacteraceae bacterium]